MKRLSVFFFIIGLIAAFGFSQSIIVTNPHSGQTWNKGNTYTITWTKSGTMNANVKIRLMQGSTKILSITDSTENDGSYSWTVPASIANGFYYVRVKTIDNTVYDDGEVFTIGNSSAARITVTSPHSGQTWNKGNTCAITWTKTGTMNSNVKIRLMRGGTKVLAITNSTANDGSYSWTIPSSLANGSYYIRVKTTDNAVYDDSNEFNITDTTAPASIGTMLYELKPHKIKVLSIPYWMSFPINSTIRIRWEAENLTHPIRILLMRHSDGILHSWVIKDNLNPDIGYYDWKPKEMKGILPFPNYYIKIEEIGTGIHAVSGGLFELKPEVHVDLSIRLTNERVPYLETEHGTAIVLSFRVRDNDPRHGILRNVPVRVTVGEQTQTKTIHRIQFGRYHYEYTVDFTFHLYDRHRSHTVNNTFHVTATVDPQDFYHDYDRSNNTINFDIVF